MRAIGTSEAKTHLPEVLKAVETGETIVITRRGIPITRLVPVEHGASVDPSAVIARIRRARDRAREPHLRVCRRINQRYRLADMMVSRHYAEYGICACIRPPS